MTAVLGQDDRDRYREAISHFATGVTVISAHGTDGPAGLTANALTSVSLDPLLLLVCLDRTARTLRLIRSEGSFAVNILRHEQHALSGVFASKGPEREKFDGVPWRLQDGVPVLTDALAWITCKVRELHQGGDHAIAVASVIDFAHDPSGQPLIWYRSRYGSFAGGEPAEAELI